ncbi:hypothetical protein N8203_02430 [Crocinitomicaceae bacterium]|nr:hypothetical protein [Crocinitomicaceae bacterium]
MKSHLSILLLIAILISSCASNEKKVNQVKSTIVPFPKELINIPTGIEVNHSKEVVYAELNKKDPETRGKYKWHFETTVNSIDEDLTITEFGAYVLIDGKWDNHATIYARPFNNEEFEKWYECPEGILTKKKKFTDFNNWSKGNNLDGKTRKTLWYFIGINSQGKKYKGTKEIITISKLVDKE